MCVERKLTIKKMITICADVLLIFGFVQTSRADLYIGTGIRSTGEEGGLMTDDAWDAAHGGFQIEFSVTQTGNYWDYTYTFSNDNEDPLSPAITKFLKLEVSNITGAHYWYYDVDNKMYIPLSPVPTDPGFHLWDAPETDPYYKMYHVKIGSATDVAPDELSSDGTITIRSTQAPTWGSFYARGTSNAEETVGPAEAVNSGLLQDLTFVDNPFPTPDTYIISAGPIFYLGQDLNDTEFLPWILVPDTYTYVVPTPTAIFLGILGLSAVGIKLHKYA